MKWTMVCGGAVLTAFLGAAMWVDACSCAAPPPPKEAMAKSTAVFLAKVTDLQDDPVAKSNWMVTLQVEQWWKGGDTKTITVSTHKSGDTCGYGFNKDGRYLVYAHGKDGRLLVSLCSRTTTFAQADKTGEFKELGDSKAPAK